MPWKVAGESTLAAGPLEIYRVPGSVSFLHSGALLHAILPRSNCWCVDGVSIFALRVLPETYYRIELPGETPEDLERVEALKVTLRKVLFFERTPCPFAREFTVELPEQDETEVKIRRRKSSGPAKKWRLQKAYSWRPEGWEGDIDEEPRERQDSGGSTEEEETDSADVSQDEARSASRDETQEDEPPKQKMPLRTPVRELAALRSVTAPPQLSLRSTPPSRIRESVQLASATQPARRNESPGVGRIDAKRLNTFQAIPTDMPPSPPDSSAGAESRELTGEVTGDVGTEAEPDHSIHQTQDIMHGRTEDEAPQQRNAEHSQTLEVNDSRHGQHHDPGVSDCNDDRDATIAPEVVSNKEDSLPRSLASSIGEAEPSTAESPKDVPELNAREAPDEEPSKPVKVERVRTPSDPYAAIQARIQARRSIGGATTPSQASSALKSLSSSASSSTTTLPSRTKLSSKPSRPNLSTQRSLTTALVNKACAIFLGPPAHLVALMLKIAARFTDGAFGTGSVFLVESPVGSPRRVPGSFYVDEEDMDEGLVYGEEAEDDFGVPLRSPVRVAGLRERRDRGWGVE